MEKERNDKSEIEGTEGRQERMFDQQRREHTGVRYGDGVGERERFVQVVGEGSGDEEGETHLATATGEDEDHEGELDDEGRIQVEDAGVDDLGGIRSRGLPIVSRD